MGENVSAEATKLKESIVLETKTPTKKRKKIRKSMAINQEKNIAPVENTLSEATDVVKDYSINQTKTPTKPSKKKRKSMAVGQIKTDVSVENVVAKAIEIPQESSVIASETPSKKNSTSIAVDQKETVSGENISAEATKLKESIVLETKTPTKKRKKIRKSMSVSQEKTIVAIENALAKPTEVVKDYSINHVEKTSLCETKVKNKISGSKEKLSVLHIKTPNKKKRTSIKDEMSVSNKKVLAETTELVEECVTESKTLTKK